MIIVTGKVLEEEEMRELSTQVVSILSKESTSREEAIAKFRDALVSAANARA